MDGNTQLSYTYCTTILNHSAILGKQIILDLNKSLHWTIAYYLVHGNIKTHGSTYVVQPNKTGACMHNVNMLT